jgi:polysaccharide pyruvyl transferase WcaK-like protein
MHSCIFAMVADVPAVGLAYQPKFHELFTRLGFPERCFDIGRFEVGATLARIDEAMLQGTGIVRERVTGATAGLLQGLEKCWQAGGFPPPPKAEQSWH